MGEFPLTLKLHQLKQRTENIPEGNGSIFEQMAKKKVFKIALGFPGDLKKAIYFFQKAGTFLFLGHITLPDVAALKSINRLHDKEDIE